MRDSYSLRELSLETGCEESKVKRILMAFSNYFKSKQHENSFEECYHSDSLNTLRQILELAEAGKSAMEIREILETMALKSSENVSDEFVKNDDYHMRSELRGEKNPVLYNSGDTGEKLIENPAVFELLKIIADQKKAIEMLEDKIENLEGRISRYESGKNEYEDLENRIVLKVNEILAELFYKEGR